MYQCHICKDFEYTTVAHTIAFRLCVGSRVASLTMDFRLCVGSRVASLTMDFKLRFMIGALSFSGHIERVGECTNLLARSLHTL